MDNTLATALIDRLMHHGEALVIKGDSYRMKDKPRRPTQRLTPAGAAVAGQVVRLAREPACREWSRKSSPPTSNPPRPRAARAADRFVRGSKSPGPGPVLPAAPFDELCPSTRAILRRLSAIPRRIAFGGGPVRSRPTQRPRTTRQQLRVRPRQATTPGRPLLHALTRVPS